MKKDKTVQKLTLSALFMALCIVLPFLTGQIPKIGNLLCPMHIPVLLCGFLCGWQYGATIGLFAPVLRFLLFGMPVIFPMGIGMAFELATYGLISGLVWKKSAGRKKDIYISLIIAMLAGRLVWGIVRFLLAVMFDLKFPLELFLTQGFLTAIPAILLQIFLIPFLVYHIKQAGQPIS